jgi:hypothetical protein
MISSPIHSLLAEAKVEDLARSAPIISPEPVAARRGGDHATRRFIGHYAEMVAVMFAGMFVLMAPTGMLFSAVGTSWSALSPAMNTFTMAMTMTVPMVAWMRLRGHSWRVNAEMAASMLVPTFGVMAALWAGVAHTGSVMVPEHVAMLSCMLVAMLLRRQEYSCATHTHGRSPLAIPA